MGRLAQEGEVFTLDNWGPCWLRISYGQYKEVSSQSSYNERKPISFAPKRRIAVLDIFDGSTTIYKDAYEFAELIGRRGGSIVNAVNATQRGQGWKVKSRYIVKYVEE